MEESNKGSGKTILTIAVWVAGLLVALAIGTKLAKLLRKIFAGLPQIPVDTVMLGTAGAGKTTIVLAIQKEFRKIENFEELALSLDRKTQDRVELKHKEIQQYEQLIADGLYPSGGIRIPLQGTGQHEDYAAFLSENGKNPLIDWKLKLHFHDYPGGWVAGDLNRAEDRANRGIVIEQMRKSTVHVIAIDAPYLMEKDGQWNEVRNRPAEIADLFKAARPFAKGDHHLVLLVPVRCEAYLANRSPELALRVKNAYWELLAICKDEQWADKVKVAITPVQTVGFLVFNDFAAMPLPAEYPDPIFLPNPDWMPSQMKLTPRFTDQTLYHIMIHALTVYVSKSSEMPKFAKVLKVLHEQLMHGNGFETVQAGYDR